MTRAARRPVWLQTWGVFVDQGARCSMTMELCEDGTMHVAVSFHEGRRLRVIRGGKSGEGGGEAG